MRIIRINPGLTHCHNYRQILNIEKKKYDEVEKIYAENDVFIPGSWKKSMEDLGIEALDTIYYDLDLFKLWFEKYKTAISSDEYALIQNSFDHAYLISKQIEIYKPDYVYLYAGGMLCVDQKVRKRILNICKHKFKFVGFWADELPREYSYENFFSDIDKIFVSTNSYKKMLQNEGYESIAIGNCYTLSSIDLEYRASNCKKIDLLFLGTTGYGVPEHIPRYEFLKKLCEDNDINVKIISNEPSYIGDSINLVFKIKISVIKILSCLPLLLLTNLNKSIRIKKINTALKIATESKLNSVNPINFYHYNTDHRSRYFEKKQPLHVLYPQKVQKDVIFGRKYYKILNNSKIILNIHRSEIHDYGNVRCFEATGVGSVLMTNRVASMAEYFVEGEEFVGYESYEEFKEKYMSMINDSKLMDKISFNGREKTLKNYTSYNQCLKFVNEIK